MAAAALLRSVATHSGPGGSLPPPTSNEKERGDRLVVPGFRYLATKLARAPLPPHHRFIHEHALHSCASPNSGASGSTPPSPSKMDLRTTLAKATADVAYFTLFGTLTYICRWVMPVMDKLEDKLVGCSRKSSNLNNNLIQDMEHVLDEGVSNVSKAQIMQSSGHGKQLDDGATEKGTRAYTLEEDFAKVHRGINKEFQAGMEDIEAVITELKISLESARSKGKGKEVRRIEIRKS